MKGDMGGAAAVTGLMHALAARKAKVNAVGVIGLVENMPDGAAQRPGDIVTAMSGKTIEIINTDAEGRLVLADAHRLHRGALQAEVHDRPRDADRRDHRRARPPLRRAVRHRRRARRRALMPPARRPASGSGGCRSAPEYDKLIDSQFADVKNTGGRVAGSITGAQFIKRFVKDTPWVASRHRRHGDGLAADRDQPLVGLGLGRAPPRPAGRGQYREIEVAGGQLRKELRAMTREEVKTILDRVSTWPPERQELAAEMLLLLETEDEELYHPSAEEHAAIHEGVEQTRRGELASVEEMKALWRRPKL